MSQYDEFNLINSLKRHLEKHGDGVLVGIGDDAAVLRSPENRLLAAMDVMIEGVHFIRGLITPFQLGAKALAVNISDIAAMGGKPLYALVTLGITSKMEESYLSEIYRGMNKMAAAFGVDIVGGDTTVSPAALLIDVCLLGEVNNPLLRTGAKPGELLAVTGTLGDSAAGLRYMLKYKEGLKGVFENSQPKWPKALPPAVAASIIRHLEPKPQVEAALKLQELQCVGAMQDISDGLASEVNHISSQSMVGAVIREDLIPCSNSMLETAELLGLEPLEMALNGGEDYQLLCSIAPCYFEAAKASLKNAGISLSVIGEVLEEKGVWLEREGKRKPLTPGGYNHFKN